MEISKYLSPFLIKINHLHFKSIREPIIKAVSEKTGKGFEKLPVLI